ncbi:MULTISPECIES: hypothetical protein [unclassified Nocardiopsis]|uniref:hypothetical protein n=1 Tax=unclassified Nocardiopsis TaxID=2649073 RepID=UPI001359803C|nr:MULTISPECIES: hypothetical protein [unclassified Nocardiopsis]
MLASRLPGLLALALAAPLLVSCQPAGGVVGAVATGHFSAQHKLPVLILSWCGDAGPQQIDLIGGAADRHLVATRAFDGHRLEVDLSAPGEDWRITDDEGRQVFRLGPESAEEEYLVGVGSRAADPGRDTEHDLGTVVFTTGALATDEGVYSRAEGSREGEYVPVEEFPPEC